MSQDPRLLVAPELSPLIELFPPIDFAGGPEVFRSRFDSRQRPPLAPELETVTMEERFVPGAAGAPDVRVLHYTPPGSPAGPRPALLHIHGGGYVLGTPEISDASNRAFALSLDAVVVSVDYRLAPETVWPGALEDCAAALQWLHDNAATLCIDPTRIAVSGESAGGGHAMALALHTRDQRRKTPDGPKIAFLLLDSPMLDDRTGTSSDPHPHCGHFIWKAEMNRYGWGAMLGVEAGGEVPVNSVPARFDDVSDLPTTFISVGSLDLFLEEDMEFFRRLTRAGVPAELHVVPGAYHGFSIAQGTPQVVQTNALRQAALARALGVK